MCLGRNCQTSKIWIFKMFSWRKDQSWWLCQPYESRIPYYLLFVCSKVSACLTQCKTEFTQYIHKMRKWEAIQLQSKKALVTYCLQCIFCEYIHVHNLNSSLIKKIFFHFFEDLCKKQKRKHYNGINNEKLYRWIL